MPAERVVAAVDVVVPAQDEAASLELCLRALLAGAADLDVRVVIVLNGCTDESPDVARRLADELGGPGRQIVVVLRDRPGKAAALRLAQGRLRREVVVVYLDADTVLLPGALRATTDALLARSTPALCSPRAVVVRPDGRVARGWSRVWTELPSVKGDVIGAGCYAVNPSGQERITGFPEVVADDAWARSRFPREQRLVTDPGFLLVLPELRELPSVLGRWRRGNADLRHASPSAGGRVVLRTLLRRPWLWTSVPAYAGVLLMSRLIGRRHPWSRSGAARRRRSGAAPCGRPQVQVLVFTHNSRRWIDGCLESVRSDLADLHVTVIDSGSVDGTAHHVAVNHPGATLVAHDQDVGRAAGVNGAAAGREGDFLVLLDPECRLEPATLDVLIATTWALGSPGITGGLAPDERRRALRRGRNRPRMTGVRSVPVLSGTLLLVDRGSWERLGGLDDGHRNGAGADLCRRALRAGLRVTFTEHARYVRGGQRLQQGCP